MDRERIGMLTGGLRPQINTRPDQVQPDIYRDMQ
ncbi:hypothetical protein IGB42_00382 [Andreprevotia sp. IGB-42]|nr:hypothetical protein IGB42_00382 [Andreprevotia sp. IGB-42]